jgi:hypothetical protein
MKPSSYISSHVKGKHMRPRYIFLGAIAVWFGLFIIYAVATNGGQSKKIAVKTPTTQGTIANIPANQYSDNAAPPPQAPFLQPIPTQNPDSFKLDKGLKDPSQGNIPPTPASPILKQETDLQKLADEGWSALGSLPWSGKGVTIYYSGIDGPRFVLNVVIKKGTQAHARAAAVAYIRGVKDDPSRYNLTYTGKAQQGALATSQLKGNLAVKDVFLSLLPYSEGHISAKFIGARGSTAKIEVVFGGKKVVAQKEFTQLLKRYGRKQSRYIVVFKHS